MTMTMDRTGHDWIAHLEAHGFAASVHDDGNSEARQRIGVPLSLGSPGMDGPAYAGRKHPFDVLLVQRDGRSTVFQSCR
jgi:hypothetical protein